MGKEAARLVDETEIQLRMTTPSYQPDTFKERIQFVRSMLRIIQIQKSRRAFFFFLTILETTEETIIATYPEVDVNEGPEAVKLCVDLVLFPRIYPTLFDWFVQKVHHLNKLICD